MAVIRWESPGPEPYDPWTAWADQLEHDLRQAPGQWALIHASTDAREIAQLQLRFIGRTVWCRVRHDEQHQALLYACWSPTPPEPDPGEDATIYQFPTTTEAPAHDTHQPDRPWWRRWFRRTTEPQ